MDFENTNIIIRMYPGQVQNRKNKNNCRKIQKQNEKEKCSAFSPIVRL